LLLALHKGLENSQQLRCSWCRLLQTRRALDNLQRKRKFARLECVSDERMEIDDFEYGERGAQRRARDIGCPAQIQRRVDLRR
jgi:hypothetical protein